MNYFSELKRRNVFKVAVAYLVLSWVILQIIDVITPLLFLPDWSGRLVLVLLAIMFPITMFMTWAFELTPEGVKKTTEVDEDQSIRKTTGQKINYIIFGLMAVAIIFLLYDRGPAPEPEQVAIDEPALTEDAIPVNSIAVLPFINMSSDPEQEYFSDGISEEILNVLAQIKDLKVTSRSSSFMFKGEGQDIPAVARQLGVSKILEGSVRKSGNRIRITAQLIEAGTNFHLWSATYDRDLSDIFAVQDEISRAIVDALKTTLNIDAATVNFEQGTENMQAFEHYVLGKNLFERRIEESLLQAKTHFEQAIELDPEYGLAWSKLSYTYTFLRTGRYGSMPNDEAFFQAGIAAKKAEELSPEMADVQHDIANFYIEQRNSEDALPYVIRALEINPNHAGANRFLALIYQLKQQYVETLKTYEKAATLDPLSPIISSGLAGSYERFEQFDKASAVVERMKVINVNGLLTARANSSLRFAMADYSKLIIDYRNRLTNGGVSDAAYQTSAAAALAIIGNTQEASEINFRPAQEPYRYYYARDFDGFLTSARSISVLTELRNSLLARAELNSGNYKNAIAIWEQAGVCGTVFRYRNCQYLTYARKMAGDNEGARQGFEILDRIDERAEQENFRQINQFPAELNRANTLTLKGDVDDAMVLYKRQLEKGYLQPYIFDPIYSELHAHPDWPEFLEDIKAFQAEQQAKLAELEAAG